MNELTKIKYEKVANAVDIISTNKKNLQEVLTSYNNILHNSINAGVLEGQAANELENKFIEFKSKFDTYIQTVTEFENMISYAKNETEETEQFIKNAASNLAS